MGFLAALQFLTIMPPLVRRPFTPAELGRAVGWFALIGLFVGTCLAGLDRLAGLLFPPLVSAALILAAWVGTTGALHLDGFLDCCDGLFGGHTPEARLRIMHDERVGAFAVTGGILLLLVKYACLASLAGREVALVVAPTLGRWGMVLAMVFCPYARPEGLGRAMKDHAGGWPVVLASVTAVAVAVVAARWLGVAALALTAVTIGAGALFVLRRLPGLTGDVYGALCELSETLTLLAFVAGERR